MKERWIYLMMFFVFCVFINQEQNSKNNIDDHPSAQVQNVQSPIKGYVSDNSLQLKKPAVKRISSVFRIQKQSVETICKIPVNNRQSYCTNNLNYEPPLPFFKLNLYNSDGNDDDHHCVA